MTAQDPAPNTPPGRPAPTLAGAAAFGVHLLTAIGAALALMSLFAAAERRWSLMFLWLGVALIVDTIDGPIARRVRVAQLLPRWSGDVLDLVVDFLTYVFIPAFAIANGGFLPQPGGVISRIVIVAAGVLYFAAPPMKTEDNYFRGFPAPLNAVAFYLFLLRPNVWAAGALIVIPAIFTFVPIVFIHPFRVVRLRALNAALLLIGGVLVVVAIVDDLTPGPWVTGALCAICIYFGAAGLWRRSSDPAANHH